MHVNSYCILIITRLYVHKLYTGLVIIMKLCINDRGEMGKLYRLYWLEFVSNLVPSGQLLRK